MRTYLSCNRQVIAWGWILVGLGLLTLQTPSSPTSAWVLYPMVASVGIGLLQTGTTFPTQAPLEPRLQPHALGVLNFVRSFGQVLGIACVSSRRVNLCL